MTALSPRNISAATLLALYQGVWTMARPFLRLSERLRQGWEERTLDTQVSGPFDIWMQAASVGEAYLARRIFNELSPKRSLRLLATACTAQGLEILKDTEPGTNVELNCAFFPFDDPRLMRRAVATITPKVLVLLETELWPGLLGACKEKDVAVLLLNGRLSRRSLAGYLAVPRLWPELAPDRICAISGSDASRFRILFPASRIEEMPNIKFDSCLGSGPMPYVKNPLAPLVKPGSPFLVLGSVRQEEEAQLAGVITDVLAQRPMTMIGLFPRHAHRIEAWEERLDMLGVPHLRRSALESAIPPGTVVVWDRFGELIPAYALARAAYVGGSLVPLGGQNFLEALGQGVSPCIGPHWDNFAWAGRDFIDAGLVREVGDAEELTPTLLHTLSSPPSRENVFKHTADLLTRRQGGTAFACQAMLETL